MAPPVGARSRRVRFVFFYRTSYVGSASRQHLATVIRYADCVKQPFQTSWHRLVANFTSFITWLLRLWFKHVEKKVLIIGWTWRQVYRAEVDLETFWKTFEDDLNGCGPRPWTVGIYLLLKKTEMILCGVYKWLLFWTYIVEFCLRTSRYGGRIQLLP